MPNADLLLVDYPRLVMQTASEVKKIMAFLGMADKVTASAMISAVRPELYRVRKNKAEGVHDGQDRLRPKVE